jgi:hypothetical protein
MGFPAMQLGEKIFADLEKIYATQNERRETNR